jgi:hypothetical protein
MRRVVPLRRRQLAALVCHRVLVAFGVRLRQYRSEDAPCRPKATRTGPAETGSSFSTGLRAAPAAGDK